MREDTLIVFCSDNGGTRDKMYAGEGAVSGELPPDNGPYRGGKGSLYEGGTRVVALANWPGRIEPGVVDGMMHMVDMYPTLATLAGADMSKTKPLDGIDVWNTMRRNDPSPRVEVVHNIEPYRGAVRQGDWKVRAVGQGYAGGLAQLIPAHGIEVDAPAAPPPSPCCAPAAPRSRTSPSSPGSRTRRRSVARSSAGPAARPRRTAPSTRERRRQPARAAATAASPASMASITAAPGARWMPSTLRRISAGSPISASWEISGAG